MTKPLMSTPEQEFDDWYDCEHAPSCWASDYEEVEDELEEVD